MAFQAAYFYDYSYHIQYNYFTLTVPIQLLSQEVSWYLKFKPSKQASSGGLSKG
jgi:hypothetical protein